MFILPLFCKATSLLRPIFIENFSGQVLLYKVYVHLIDDNGQLYVCSETWFVRPKENSHKRWVTSQRRSKIHTKSKELHERFTSKSAPTSK